MGRNIKRNIGIATPSTVAIVITVFSTAPLPNFLSSHFSNFVGSSSMSSIAIFEA